MFHSCVFPGLKTLYPHAVECVLYYFSFQLILNTPGGVVGLLQPVWKPGVPGSHTGPEPPARGPEANFKKSLCKSLFTEVLKYNTGSLETQFCKCSFCNRPLLHSRKHLYGYAVNKNPQTQPSRTLSRNYFKMSTEPPNQSQLELVSGLCSLPFQSKRGRWGHEDLGTLTIII